MQIIRTALLYMLDVTKYRYTHTHGIQCLANVALMLKLVLSLYSMLEICPDVEHKDRRVSTLCIYNI